MGVLFLPSRRSYLAVSVKCYVPREGPGRVHCPAERRAARPGGRQEVQAAQEQEDRQGGRLVWLGQADPGPQIGGILLAVTAAAVCVAALLLTRGDQVGGGAGQVVGGAGQVVGRAGQVGGRVANPDMIIGGWVG